MGSFSLSGGVEVLGFISPTDSLDTYAVIDPLYGIDGFRNVNSISDLNNIPEPRRRSGMVVGVSGGTQYYKLLQSPWTYTISDWGIFNTGGSNSGTTQSFTGGTVTGSTVFTNGLSATTISATTIGTSGDCVDDIYVSNIHSCSPLNINPLNEGNVYFGSTSAVTIDLSNNRVGVGVPAPTVKLHLSGNSIFEQSKLTINQKDGIVGIDIVNSGESMYQLSNSITDWCIVGKTPSEFYFYNSLNVPIRFYTNASEKMTVLGNGNVGIGITSPTAKLHINNTTSGNTFLAEDDTNPDSTPFVIDLSGNTGIGTLTPTVKLQVSGKTVINSTLSGSSFEKALSITNTSQEIFYVRGFGDAFLATTLYLGVQNGNNFISSGTLRIQSSQSVGQSFVQFNHNNGTTAFRILSNTNLELQPSAGNVLIGTTNDLGYKLNVNGSTNIGGDLVVSGITGTTWFSGNSSSDLVRVTQTGSGNAFVVEDSNNPDSSPFVIDASGNTGIGTLTPQAKLDIFASSALTNTLRIRETGNAFNHLTIDNSGTTTIRTNGDGLATQFSVVHNGGTENFRVRENGNISFRSAYAFDNSSQLSIFVGRNLTNGLNIGPLNNYDTPNTNRNLVGFTPSFVWGSGNNTGSTLNIEPTYNISGGSTTALVRGIYYNPTLTSLSGTTHRAIETTTGDVIFGSTSGNVGIGTTTPSTKLDVAGGDVALNGNRLFLGSYLGNQVLRNVETTNLQLFNSVGVLYLNAGDRVIFGSNNSTSGRWATFFNTGNLLIQSGGTHTDAGYRLDVNGNTRVIGDLTVTGSVIPNTQIISSSVSVTPTYGNDLVAITGLSTNVTINNPTGTWPEGKDLTIRIKDDGVARTITWDTKYRAIGVTLPNTTIASKTTYIGLIYNSIDDKFDVIGSTTEL